MIRRTSAWGLLAACLLGGCSLLNQGGFPVGVPTTAQQTQAPVDPSQAPVEPSETPGSVRPTIGRPGSPGLPSPTDRVSATVPVASPAGTVTVTVRPSAPPPSPAGDVRSTGAEAAFASPSGRIVCLMYSEGVRCDYVAEDRQWKVPVQGCQLAWGFILTVSKTAGGGCVGDTIADTPRVGNAPYTSWWKPGDGTTTVGQTGLTSVALPYGTAVQTSGGYRCDSATTGVTCRNLATGHGFMISRETYQLF